MILSTIAMLNMPYTQLRLVIVAIGLGYIFHLFADLPSKGSIPLFFPIPTLVNGHWVLWRKPYLLGNSNFAITTGGTLNIILNFVMMGADILLAYILFIKK